MMDIAVSPEFRETTSHFFGILPHQALAAVRDADSAECIHIDNLEIGVHVKHERPVVELTHAERTSATFRWRTTLDASLNADASTTLIVVTTRGTIRSAVRIYDQLHRHPAGQGPLSLLKSALDRIGVPLRIGATTSTLFAAERVPLAQADGPVAATRQRLALHQWLWSVDVGPPRVAVCGLCYSIDVDRYRSYLRAQPPVETGIADARRSER